jgi:transcriptional regulator with XRE-family HTH domain
MDDIHSRIKKQRLLLKFTLQYVADELGVSYQTVQRWEMEEGKGGTAPKRFRLKKVADLLKTTQEWLLTGINANVEIRGSYAFIPLYSTEKEPGKVRFHETVADFNDDNNTYAYRVDYLRKKNLEAFNCRVVIAPDDTMDIGEQLLIDITDKKVQSGKIYVFESVAGIGVRKLFPRADGLLTLRADRADVPEEHASPNDLTIIGRVVGFTG